MIAHFTEKEDRKVERAAPSAIINPASDLYVRDHIKKVCLHNVAGDIRHLTGFSTRFAFSGRTADVREWIYGQFKEMGYTDVAYQDFILCDTLQRNVICSKKGRSDKVLILCAHYDSTARSTAGWDWERCPAPGANDNATGVAAMLEIARILRDAEMSCTLRFIAFAGEEQGMWGGRAYSEYARTNDMEIALVINLDEIGYPDAKWSVIIGEDRGNHSMEANPASHEFANVMAKTASEYTSLIVHCTDIWSSDHIPFNSAGYAVVGVCQAGKYPYSHEITDTYDKINVDFVVEVTKMTLATIICVAGKNPGEVR